MPLIIERPSFSSSGPWTGEFGCWERGLSGELTPGEVALLDGASPGLEVMVCLLPEIGLRKLRPGWYSLSVHDKEETWHYDRPSLVDPAMAVFSRPRT